jgi:hypothetical protein
MLTRAFLLTMFCIFIGLRSSGAVSQAGEVLRTPSQRFGDQDGTEKASFRRHVIPLLARAGCSARECHGSFQGRGGFQLSLFGSEWDQDFEHLTRVKGDEGQTHINPADPQQSLILLKPTLQMKHKGKERFKKDSWQYNLILNWIRSGAVNDAGKTGELQRLEVTPSELLFSAPGQSVKLRVLAHWIDGTIEDVTELARFKTNDETVANVSESGSVSCMGKGDSHVVVSYDSGVSAVAVVLPVSQPSGSASASMAARTRVDELVLNKLRKVGIVPSGICNDAEYLRRVRLDLTGTLPSPDEVRQFLADSSPDKRTSKIDELLKSPAYAAWWATKFCDYTGNSQVQIGIGGFMNRKPAEFTRQWYSWLYKRLASNVPYDQMMADIVLALGRSSPEQSYQDYVVEMNTYYRSNNPVDFAEHKTLTYFWQRRNVQTPEERVLAFSHSFLGIRLECAQCHKHPFDRWTKSDFKQFTIFFANIKSDQNRPVPKGETVSYQGIAKEIRDKVEAELDAQTPGFAAALEAFKADKEKKDAVAERTRQARIGKAVQAEVERRMNAGELVPWAELWMKPTVAPPNVKPQRAASSPVTPKLLGGEEVALSQYADQRIPVMNWLRDKSNPYFAKAIVNRIWANYFNRGIIDPPDDLNLANPPCNSELLDYLTEGFIAQGYDLQWLHRQIIGSETYQRSWETNATNSLDRRNFSHAIVRQLPAEVMLDAVDMALIPSNELSTFAGAIDTRAIGPLGAAPFVSPGKPQLSVDTYFLKLFGKPNRENNCDCARSSEPTLLQTLFTRNDQNLLIRIDGRGKNTSSWIAELRQTPNAKLDVDKTIEEVFLRTLSRFPTGSELADARADIAASKFPVDGVRDLLWTMINIREFKLNH